MTIDKTKKILIIVESPNKISTISQILKKAGYNNIKVVASVGHIMYLANGGSYYNSGIEPNKNFELNLKIAEDKYKVVEDLKAQVKAADIVYLMTDGDREGHVISWSLIKFLKIPKTKYRRAVTHEITPQAVIKALENPIPMEEAMVEAGLARMTIDKMIGFSLSPIAKSYIGAKSVGRCQSVGLKLIVDRENEIQNFKPEKYIDLYLHFNKNGTQFKAKYIGTEENPIEHISSPDELKNVYKQLNKTFNILSINNKEKQEQPKPPFCTSTFQQEVSSKLGLKVKDAMSVAQKLFEGININGEHMALITYIRTDDTSISDDFIPTLKNYIESTYGKSIYTAPRKGKKQENSQEGHECLRVTDPTMTPEKLSSLITNDLQLKVYKIIWQRTIAAAMPNATISETTYIINNNNHLFKLVSNEILDEGYRKIYNYKDDEVKDDDTIVKETFKVGEKLINTQLEDVTKETKPPHRYSEATLIKRLQTEGVGRPSTFATIVETVLSPTRGYCNLEDRTIVPTDRGIQLANFLDRSFSNIINISYTKDMEKSLDMIASGKISKLDFLNNFYENLEKTIRSNTEASNTSQSTICPKCGSTMVIRRSRFGKLFYGCSNYPKCNGIVNIN